MKKIIIAILGVLVTGFFAILLINYISNESMIKEYEEGVFSIRDFKSLGFTQPYIEPYNEGCIYYKQGDYENALYKFREALEHNTNHKNDVECKIRINLVLSMIAPIDFENMTESDYEAIIVILEESIKILTEENCAHMEDESGHNKDAQKLKDELQEILDYLKNPPEDGGSDSNNQDPQNNDDQNNNDPNEDEKDDIQDQLEQIQEQSGQERTSEIQETDNMDGYDFFDNYDEPVW